MSVYFDLTFYYLLNLFLFVVLKKKRSNRKRSNRSKLVKAYVWRKKHEFKVQDFTATYSDYVTAAGEGDSKAMAEIVKAFLDYVTESLVPVK